MAGGQGLEPWITGPEPVVLPLYYPPVNKKNGSFGPESQVKIWETMA